MQIPDTDANGLSQFLLTSETASAQDAVLNERTCKKRYRAQFNGLETLISHAQLPTQTYVEDTIKR